MGEGDNIYYIQNKQLPIVSQPQKTIKYIAIRNSKFLSVIKLQQRYLQDFVSKTIYN